MRLPNKLNRLKTAVLKAKEVPELPLGAPDFEAYEKEMQKALRQNLPAPEPAEVQTKIIGKSK